MKKKKWVKAYVKSIRLALPQKKLNSQYYGHLVKAFGEEKATTLYNDFKYLINHGR